MRGKRIKQFILILCMVCLFGMNVQAEDVYTEFHVDNQKGKAGDVVTVPVEFNTGQEVGGFQISIYYDKEVLEFQSLEAGDLIEKAGGGIFDYNHIEESSEIIVVYVVPDTVKNEGSIVDLKFKLKKDCTEKLPIGMKPDEVVDNTESSNPITGEVSGVDKEFQEKVVGDLAVVSTDQNKSDRSKSDDKSDKKSDKDKDKSKSEKESSDDKKDSSESGEKGKGDSGKKDADKADKDKKSKKLSAEDFKALAAFFGVMILSGVVSVNAEAEQTQDEAVSGAKQEETVSDVQMQDETVNDAQQDVTTGEEVEEGAAGDIQKLPGMSAESTDAMLNTTSQEDVIGSITLKKDGTEESGSIMLQEDQTSVRYQLNVEEDGQYYITATGDNYWSTYASITEETEDGTQDVEIINSRVELRKAGTYYLELSDYSSESQKIIKWKAGKVKDITPGEFDIELNEEKPEAYYRLTVDESGVYYVRSVKGMSVKIRDTQTGNEILSSSSFYKLKKENVYEITLGRYSWENASGKWGILKGIEKEVECDKVYINETDGVYYKFVPKTTGYYSVEGGFYDEEWNQIYSEEMLAGNAYYLAPYGRYWCIKQSEYTPIDPGGSGGKVQVKVGETYTHDMRKGGFYEFIPKETASYHFRSNENVKLEVKERIFEINGIGTLEGKVDYSVVMRAGSVYWIHLYEMDAATVTWTIEKTKTKTAVTGTKYTAVKGGSDTYDFVPSKSGDYSVSFNGKGGVLVYDDAWNEIKKYYPEEADGSRVVLSLEQGKTYHFAVAALEKDMQREIESAKTKKRIRIHKFS